jgi:hypothetical protein
MTIAGINYLTGDDTVEPLDWTHFAAILMCGDAETDPSSYGLLFSDLVDDSIGEFASDGYTTTADLAAGIANFTATLGLPWVAVGDPTAYPPAEHYSNVATPVAVDISRATGWSDSGSGIVFSGVFSGVYTGVTSTLGYAPWDNYDDANTALTALAALYNGGYFTFDGS